jgi:hypothetical protein
VPIILTGAGGAAVLAIAATGMIYLSYFLCNVGVFVARTKGWPHQGAWFSLRGWGTIINLVALLYGGFMIVNIGLWVAPNLFGDFGTDLRAWSNPFINTFLSWGTNADGTPAILADLPAIPVFEAVVGLVVTIGAVYYLAAQRGHADAIEADFATGEAVIG